MSRWHIARLDERSRTAVIAHACPGAHTPYQETVTFEFLDRLWHGFPEGDLGPKPTWRCQLCHIRGFDHEPHLPGPSDVRRDLEPGRYQEWRDRIAADWMRVP